MPFKTVNKKRKLWWDCSGESIESKVMNIKHSMKWGGCTLSIHANVVEAWLTSLRGQAHSIGQNGEAGVAEEARAGQVHLWGLQSKLLQLLGQQTELFTLAATFLFQVSYLWLHTRYNWVGKRKSTFSSQINLNNPPFNTAMAINIVSSLIQH